MISKEAFKPDCATWDGYRPCLIQKKEGRPDCNDCAKYEPVPPSIEVVPNQYIPEILKEVASVGIVEMDGLGSVLRTTAITKAIRELNPDAKLIWFTSRKGAELLEYVPSVTPIDIENTSFEEYAEVLPHLDVVVNFALRDKAKDIVLSTDNVAGFTVNAQNKFHGVSPHADLMQRLQIDDEFRKRNQLTMQEILLQSIGLGSSEASYDIELLQKNHDEASQIIEEAFGGSVPEGIIGLNIGTSEKGKLRRWPIQNHVELAERMAQVYPDRGILMLSGPEDNELREMAIETLSSQYANIRVLPNTIEVGSFIALVGKLNLIVTSDTFGMHAARSQGIPTLVLQGPMPPNELELTEVDALIGPKLDCNPCFHRCKQDIKGHCMQLISTEEVGLTVDLMMPRVLSRD